MSILSMHQGNFYDRGESSPAHSVASLLRHAETAESRRVIISEKLGPHDRVELARLEIRRALPTRIEPREIPPRRHCRHAVRWAGGRASCCT
jgi:hypothetical protein